MIFEQTRHTRSGVEGYSSGDSIASCCGAVRCGEDGEPLDFNTHEWGILVQIGEHGIDTSDDGVSITNHITTSNGIISIKQRYDWGGYEYPNEEDDD